VLVSGVGTGGTISGVSRYIKNEKGKKILSVAVEPSNSPVISQRLSKQSLRPGPHKIQGIGAGFIPDTLDLSMVDRVELVSNEESIEMARRLVKEEGILGGISCGAALAVAVIISCVSYTPGLGFYSDDWAFLGRYATAAEQSIHGYFTASYSEHHAMRPVQLWLCAGLYRMFGLNPLPYHLFNGLLHVINAVLCAAVARRLGVHRRIAVAVALVYVLLPSYSTDRFWFLAFAITLSMTACLASTYADLHAVTAQPRRRIIWKVAAAGALLISGLALKSAMAPFPKLVEVLLLLY